MATGGLQESAHTQTSSCSQWGDLQQFLLPPPPHLRSPRFISESDSLSLSAATCPRLTSRAPDHQHPSLSIIFLPASSQHDAAASLDSKEGFHSCCCGFLTKHNSTSKSHRVKVLSSAAFLKDISCEQQVLSSLVSPH